MNLNGFMNRYKKLHVVQRAMSYVSSYPKFEGYRYECARKKIETHVEYIDLFRARRLVEYPR